MADFGARMAALRVRFLTQARGEVAALSRHAHAGQWDEAGDISHGLAGRAGMFGFAALGEAARQLDEAIEGSASADVLAALVNRLLAEAAVLADA